MYDNELDQIAQALSSAISAYSFLIEKARVDGPAVADPDWVESLRDDREIMRNKRVGILQQIGA